MTSHKVFAAALVGMLSIVFWTLTVVLVWKHLVGVELAALTTSTTTLVVAIAAWLTPDFQYVDGRYRAKHPEQFESVPQAKIASVPEPQTGSAGTAAA